MRNLDRMPPKEVRGGHCAHRDRGLGQTGQPQTRHATRRSVTTGRCFRPPSNATTSWSRAPGRPLMSVCGFAPAFVLRTSAWQARRSARPFLSGFPARGSVGRSPAEVSLIRRRAATVENYKARRGASRAGMAQEGDVENRLIGKPDSRPFSGVPLSVTHALETAG